MGVLEILDKLDQVEILYDPIYSADGHRVVAYEVIGQIEGTNKTINLEQFTYDQDAPEDIRAEIELIVLRQAIEHVKNEINDIGLYISCNPNLLMLDFGESYFDILKQEIPEQALQNITLVLAEHLFTGDIKQLHHVLKYIKTYGVKIALKDVGSKTHLENILLIEPAVLKINVSQLNYNLWGAQNHVFTTLRTLALKMGASLLIEQIETVYQLQHGWKNGARFYKGPYLEKPTKQFISRDTLKTRFRDDCEQFINTEKKLLEQRYEAIKTLEKSIHAGLEQMGNVVNDDDRLLQLAQIIESFAFRLYVCNSEGFQITSNIIRKNGTWIMQQSSKGKNWSWRPYFLSNIIKMKNDQRGDLSASYSDIETDELTRTYSIALRNNEFLFIDIAYDYLYENNIVN